MQSSLGATIGIGVGTALLAAFIGYAEITGTSGRTTGEAGGTVATRDSVTPNDSSPSPSIATWLSDANILSLAGTMNARQAASADAELQRWHIDTVRAFAASVARRQADAQHSLDSVSAKTRIAPIAPALGAQINGALQAQIDSMTGSRSDSFDRAFVRQQVASNELMAGYVAALSAIAVRPEVQAVLAGMAVRIDSQLVQAKALRAMLDTTNSAAAHPAGHRAPTNR